MGRADTAVTLMLICVQFAFAETQVYPGEHFNCNRYIDYVMKEWSCRPEGLFDISDDVMDDGIFTREELLEEISVRCSNVTLIERYINCFEELAVECPLQYLPVLNLVNEKIQMFCDGTHMSTWLLTTLENGYTYNKECFSVSSVLVESCAQELSATYQHLDVNMTMTTALEMLPQAVSDMFQCTKNKFSIIPTSYQECGSSWTDMLLTTWLQFSSTMGLGAYLSHEEKMQLQALKTGQSD